MLNNDDIKKILQKQAQGEFGLGFDLQKELERLKEIGITMKKGGRRYRV